MRERVRRLDNAATMAHPQYACISKRHGGCDESGQSGSKCNATLIALAMHAPFCGAQPQPPLTPVRDVPLPGGSSRFDYQSLDTQSGLLFIAHLGANHVAVFDTRAQRVVGTIEHIAQVHGVLALPSLRRVYASATGTNEVVAIDEETRQVIAHMPGGRYPDGLSYDPESRKLFVSDEFGHTLTVINTETNQPVRTLELGGEIGNNQYDRVSHHVFVNVQALGQLVEVDTATLAIVGRYSLPGCTSNHGLLIAPEDRLAFIAREGNARLVVLDLVSRRVVHQDIVGRPPDVLAFDPGTGHLYVASESGVVSVFRVEASGLVKEGQGWIAPRAHSVLVDPRTHLLYLPLENVNGQPVLRVMKHP